MLRLRPILGVTAAFATAAVTLTAAPVSAEPTVSDPIIDGLVTPLQVDATRNAIYVAQAFGGPVLRVQENGDSEPFITDDGSISAVAVRGREAAYTLSGGTEDDPVTLLKKRSADGDLSRLANLGRFEARNNPDADNRYGVLGIGDRCRAKVPRAFRSRGGIVESNPYAVGTAPGGGWYVADAAANAILEVGPEGGVDVVAVMKPVRERITKQIQDAAGLPNCSRGEILATEPVPTDVEQAPSGWIYVSQLPGGIEQPGLGRGQLSRINPETGKVKLLSRGFEGAVNVAVASGTAYVSELFGGRISAYDIGDRSVTPYVEVPLPGGLDAQGGSLVAGIDVLPGDGVPPDGKIVRAGELDN